MDPRRTVSPESALASDIFDKFCSANTLKAILTHYRHLCKILRLKPTHFPDFYPRLKAKLSSWRAQGLWSKFEKRASHKCYARGKACYGSRVLIIGAGPCGLRTAIEAQLLGAKVVIIEKRDRFSRNNVLHLWPFVITDLKALGAKKFYGKFCAGSIDHISIRQIQCILLKVALLLGVEVHEGVGFEGLREPTETEGWRAIVSPGDHPVSHYSFDALIGADGRRNTLTFKRKALRAKLAIAITANFLNKHTEAEARVKEISGVSYIFNQKFFQELNEATGIDLENIVYYKDETHYFVMTAKKQSLLNKGVLLQDHADTAKLLSGENISSDALMTYALEAAIFSTDNQLPDLDFAVNHYGKPDVAMFDFTAMYAAENACRVVQRKGHKLLMSLVGDSLLEPFWPTGSGCARGFLSSFDTCWMLRSWSSGVKSILEVIAERESIYRLLGQTTPENLNKEHLGYTIDPHSRYPNLNLRVVMPYQVKSLFDTDEVTIDLIDGKDEEQLLMEAEKASKKRRRESVIAVDSLLSWLREQVMGYGLDVPDICDAFIRGDVLCAIINRFRPDLIEFPLPIPCEQNVDPLDIAACRNQIAFDLLHEEHGLLPVMSGFDSVQCTSSDFLTIVAYLSQIYEVFRGEIPQIKYKQDSGEELEEYEPKGSSSHSHPRQHSSRPALVVKHTGKPIMRRSRVSSSGRPDSRVEGESESSRKHKKRRSDDRSRGSLGREIKSSTNSQMDPEKQHVPGLAKNLEEKLKGSKHAEKKPKDLIRAIGKIEKSDWNVQLIEKKIEESKTHCQSKNRDDKVPKWSREAFDDKREAMKRKMEGSATDKANDKLQLFEDTVKKLGSKLKDGNTLEVGQRGSNKVSQMAEQLVNKMPKEDATVIKPTVPRPVFDFDSKRSGSEMCHFCNERVYMMERMSSVPKPMHRNCFRCEYCNTSLRLGNYVFDREGRYGDRFYCTPHFSLIRLYGWKKYDQDVIGNLQEGSNRDFPMDSRILNERSAAAGSNLLVSTSQQILSDMRGEMDARGKTPERIEFENSLDLEEEILLSEDEWTDRNCFGVVSNVDNTSSEASDLSDDDDDITPEGKDDQNNGSAHGVPFPAELATTNKRVESSDSDGTELASGDEDEDEDEISHGEPQEEEEDDDDDDDDEEEDEDGEEDDDDDEEEEECGSTTEIETDSEFAEDPPHSVPGKIPTIVVDEPEQVVTRIIEPAPLSHTQSPQKHRQSHSKGHHHSRHHHHHQQQQQAQQQMKLPKEEEKFVDVLQYRMVEPVKRNIPVNPVPKKWQPLPDNQDHNLASKLSQELKQRYLHGNPPIVAAGTKKSMDPTAQNQFKSVLDMISEQQKLLQPAAKPSATMQAFLDGAEKLKQKQSLSPLGCGMKYSSVIGAFNIESPSPVNSKFSPWSVNELERSNSETPVVKLQDENGSASLQDMNRLNLEKTKEIGESEKEDEEKGDCEKDIDSSRCLESSVQMSDVIVNGKDTISTNILLSETPSVSQSETTDTQSTIVDTNKVTIDDQFSREKQKDGEDVYHDNDDDDACGEDTNEDSESTQSFSESDDIDAEENGEVQILREPPRVEIEDEFGVSLNIDEEFHPKSSEMPSTSEVDHDERNVCGGNDDDIVEGKSVGGGMSSSESKDSLNSGMFLDMELSDAQSGIGVSFMEQNRKKKKSSKRKESSGSSQHVAASVPTENIDNTGKYAALKASLTLDLGGAGLDFMDIDGVISSPEEMLMVTPKNQGYCKLANEEADSDSDLNAINNWNNPVGVDEEHLEKPYSSNSSRNSTPTLGGIQDPVSSNHEIIPLIKSSEEIVVQAVNPMIETEFLQILSNENKSSSSCPTNKEKFAILDRVVPFSKARDSLDYRKMKNGSSPLKSKDLYPPSYNQSQINKTGNSSISTSPPPPPPPQSSLPLEELPGGSTNQCISETMDVADNIEEEQEERSNTLKSSSSPTAKRIAEINKERVKQSDLIRSMVMGRIRRSPEKNRRGSRGSLSPGPLSKDDGLKFINNAGEFKTTNSPFGASSSSGSSEHFLKSDDQEVDTEHSTQTSSNADTTEADESQENTNSLENFVEEVNSSDDVSHTSSSSSGYSNGTSSRNDKDIKSNVGILNHHSHYEPVFTSSPRFRNRPKFDSPFSAYNSATNPPTPVNPKEPLFSPTTPSTPSENHQNQHSQQKNKNKPPSFYRSMPDLTAFLTPSSYGNSSIGFSTPKVGKWEVCKSFDREQARQAARERARLKSDHELGLEDQSDYKYKDKLRRKISVPEDDVFDPHGAAVIVTTIPSNSKTMTMNEDNKCSAGSKSRPLSDIFDNVASSIRHNVDFPIAKTNPFLVSPIDGPGTTATSASQFAVNTSSFSSPKKNHIHSSHEKNEERQPLPRRSIETDDFVHLQLRINPKNHMSERRISPEKARSMGWDTMTNPNTNFPNYFTPTSSFSPPPPSSQHPSFSSSTKSDPLWQMDNKADGGATRSRSNTFSDIGKSPACNHSISSNVVFASTAPALLPNVIASTNAIHKPIPSKSKARSSDALLVDDSSLTSSCEVSDVPSTSLPDINACSPERTKAKKPKDRERRRSIIQAMSDFFTFGGSPSSSVSNNSPEMEKSNGSPPSTKDINYKDKFSLFKLTPKLLHKDRRSSKSRETLSPSGSSDTHHNSSLTPKISKSSGFISYLSKPDIIIERLSSSPTPFKCSRNLNTRYESLDSSLHSPQEKNLQHNKENAVGSSDSPRIKEINKISMQLEAIECEQKQLELRGVSIEKKLKGEERDEQMNREDECRIEMMEEWFTLVREKTRLARLARELMVRAQQLQLEERQNHVQEQLEMSVQLSDIQKTPEQKTLEVDLLNELHALENQKGNLLGKFHEDIQKYKSDDAEFEAKIASSSLSPRESNV